MDRTLLYPYVVSEVPIRNNRSGRWLHEYCACNCPSPTKIDLKVICLKFCALFDLNHTALKCSGVVESDILHVHPIALSTEGQEGILQRVVSVKHLTISDFCVFENREKSWHDYPPVKSDVIHIFGLAVLDLEESCIHEDSCYKLKEDCLIQQLRECVPDLLEGSLNRIRA